jgi:leader peptidase (prepilin peptidase)/N-methyltransferase
LSVALVAVIAGVFGALIGSFSNVVIYRLPRGESIAFPGSHCPKCHHQLSPLELIPILSYAIQRGRCRSCGERISVRYPLVEALMAVGFATIALRWPPDRFGATLLPLLALFALLVILAMIDIDTLLLPDSLTLPGAAFALLAAFVYTVGSGLPTPLEAAIGAAVGAGVLTLINRIGSLALRRFRDTRERLWPIGFDAVNLAALGGALGGWLWGVAAAAGSVLLNLVSRRTLRLPEPIVYLLVVVALALAASGLTVELLTSLGGTAIAAGIAAVAGTLVWWLRELAGDVESESEPPAGEEEEPIAMGFGDAKLAAVLGAMLGWQGLLVGLFFAVTLGALGGLLGRLLGGSRIIPFGPYLVGGALLALAVGDALIGWYLGLLNVPL